MLTEKLRKLVQSFTSGYPHHQQFVELLGEVDKAVAHLAEDRDAGWRMAHAAASGHGRARKVLQALAERLGGGDMDDYESLPAALREHDHQEALRWKREVDAQTVEAGRAYAERDATAVLLDTAKGEIGGLQLALAERDLRIDELKQALAIGARKREALEAALSPPRPTEQPPEVVDIGLGDTRDGVRQGALLRVRRPSARWDESAVWKLERRPSGSDAVLCPDDGNASASIIADAPGTYIVSGAWGDTIATTVVTVDLHVPRDADQWPAAAFDEGAEHQKTMAHLHSTLAAADAMREALLLAGAPSKGDIKIWASNVRNTIVGLKRDLHEGGMRFLAFESARRSELAEMSAACSGLPFEFTPTVLTPIGLLLALRDAALRFRAAAMNPTAQRPVSGA